MKKNEKKFDGKFWCIVCVLIITGLLLIIISEIVTNTFVKSVLSNLSSSLLVSGVFSALNEKLLKENLVEKILSKLNLKKEIDRTGIYDVYTDLSEIDFIYYIHHSSHYIDIVHVYGRTWTSNNEEEIRSKLENSNCHIRVFIMSPDSKFIPSLESYYDFDSGELNKRIEAVTQVWTKLSQSLAKKKRRNSSISLYYYSGQPSSSIYRFDDKIIVIQNKIPKLGKTHKLPVIVCQDTKKADDLYSQYNKDIDELVIQSKKIF